MIYTTSAWSKVYAFDAATGALLWQFDPKVPGEVGCKCLLRRGQPRRRGVEGQASTSARSTAA